MSSTDSLNGEAPDGPAMSALREQLNDPNTVATLQQIFAKLEVLEFSLSALDGVMQRSEVVVENLSDGVREARGTIDTRTAASLGRLVALTPKVVEGLERLAPALEAEGLERLGDPALVDSLADLAQHAPLLVFAAESATGFLQRADTIVDNIADSVQDAKSLAGGAPGQALSALTQLGSLLPTVQSILVQVEPLFKSGSIEALLQSTILNPENVKAVSRVGDALQSATVEHQRDPKQLGLFGTLKALRDPDAQRAMGFLTTFLKEFGKQLR